MPVDVLLVEEAGQGLLDVRQDARLQVDEQGAGDVSARQHSGGGQGHAADTRTRSVHRRPSQDAHAGCAGSVALQHTHCSSSAW